MRGRPLKTHDLSVKCPPLQDVASGVPMPQNAEQLQELLVEMGFDHPAKVAVGPDGRRPSVKDRDAFTNADDGSCRLPPMVPAAAGDPAANPSKVPTASPADRTIVSAPEAAAAAAQAGMAANAAAQDASSWPISCNGRSPCDSEAGSPSGGGVQDSIPENSTPPLSEAALQPQAATAPAPPTSGQRALAPATVCMESSLNLLLHLPSLPNLLYLPEPLPATSRSTCCGLESELAGTLRLTYTQGEQETLLHGSHEQTLKSVHL